MSVEEMIIMYGYGYLVGLFGKKVYSIQLGVKMSGILTGVVLSTNDKLCFQVNYNFVHKKIYLSEEDVDKELHRRKLLKEG